MGVDLKLLPFDCDLEVLCFSHTVLNVDRDYALFDRIKEVPSIRVREGFTSYLSRDDAYEETHYGDTTEDPYGDPVRYVLASDLKTIGLPGPTGAYIEALDDDNKVALFWC